MGMTKDQRDYQIIRDLGHGITLGKARNKYDRRQKLYVVQDGDQILQEYPNHPISAKYALSFAFGYRMAKLVYDLGEERSREILLARLQAPSEVVE